eukprot:Opistho-2@2096
MPPSRSSIQEANDHIRALTGKLAEYESVVKAKDEEIMRLSMHCRALQEEVEAARDVIVQRNSELFRVRGKVALSDYILKCRPLIERLLVKMSRVDGASSAPLSVLTDAGGDQMAELLQHHEQSFFGGGSDTQFASVFGTEEGDVTGLNGVGMYSRSNSAEAAAIFEPQQQANGTATPPMFNYQYADGGNGNGMYGN